ncbi:MAG: cytochrome c3 family protein [Limisphaerales bacterium]
MKNENQPDLNNQPIAQPSGHTWVASVVRWGTAAAGVLGAVMMVSCSTVSRTVMDMPNIPGAEFVGNENCSQCHAETVRDFHTSTHARLQAKGTNAVQLGCEGCHGPGSLHAQAGGGRNNILNPRRDSETCFKCHLDKRGEFSLPHHHPVLEGKVSCGDCHNPHKGSMIAGGGTQMTSEKETCGKCHTAQMGPFVFEHEAIREGCTTCHKPHGSVNRRLLTERNSTLCLKCHFQEQQTAGALYIGGGNHATGRMKEGTCFSGGCHEEVHGSNVHSSLRY